MKAGDFFCGLGGFSEGAEQAGCEIAYAANHWPLAIEIHRRNHPGALHVCQDLHQANFYEAPFLDLLLASPACQGHTWARGKERPHHDATRSTAWAVPSYLEVHRSPVALVENVPEFTRWTLYPAWLQAMHALGYSVAPHILDAADFGVPQHRRRLFLICTHSRAPFMFTPPPRPLVPVSTIIDWNAGEWTPVERPGRSPATVRRWRAGRARFGDRFVMPYYGNGSGLTGRSIDRPLGTVTTRDRWAIVNGAQMRMMRKEEYRRAMGFPDDYHMPATHRDSVFMLGNAVCPPQACEIIRAVKEAA